MYLTNFFYGVWAIWLMDNNLLKGERQKEKGESIIPCLVYGVRL